MKTTLITFFTFLSLCYFSPAQDVEQSQKMTLMNVVNWQIGPGFGDMGKQAKIHIPEGYMFIGKRDTKKLMQPFGNLNSDRETGCLAPQPEGTNDLPWFVVFEFDKTGYVKDDEKNTLDADVLFESMLEGQKTGNKEREKRGLSTLQLIGWAQKPQYNEHSNNLEWAMKFRSEPDGHIIINHNTRLLGRHGVMEATFVIDPEKFDASLPAYQQCLSGFSYKDGKRYAEYRQGDKIAKYGLTGLMLGGGVALAAKAGLLKKLWKPIVVAFLALGAWAKKFFKRGE